jgi:23S rRNA (cytidine1920-2'-O)/16S rRNA (cytidine1409-2'-O)-methyltransferase
VDVGTAQLDARLRADARVVSLEKTNARYLSRDLIPDSPELIVIDVSFISLALILPAARGVLNPGGEVVCLIKPQFEAGREHVGKRGVVRGKKTHVGVLEKFIREAETCGFYVGSLSFSPIKGPEGNIEFLGPLTSGGPITAAGDIDAAAVVEAAHAELNGAGIV